MLVAKLETRYKIAYIHLMFDKFLRVSLKDLKGDDVFYDIDKKHLNRVKRYQSIPALLKYSKANQIQHQETACPCPPETSISSTDSQDERVAQDVDGDTPCPVSSPTPAKSVERGQGILFCDTETTGLGKDAEIIEIALVDIDENIVFESLVKPSKPIPKQATQVHGITNAMVANAPSMSEIWDKLVTCIGKHQLVFYNADFDTRIIAQSVCISFQHHFKLNFGEILLNSTHCVMNDYARYWGQWSDWHGSYKWQKLTDACHQQGIPIDDIPNHRASGDAIKTARLYKHLQRCNAL